MHRTFKVVHARELQEFFERIGQSDLLKEGKLRCNVCGSVITLENFGAVYKTSGVLQFICVNAKCLSSYDSAGR
jgi:hypothetical protein